MRRTAAGTCSGTSPTLVSSSPAPPPPCPRRGCRPLGAAAPSGRTAPPSTAKPSLPPSPLLVLFSDSAGALGDTSPRIKSALWAIRYVLQSRSVAFSSPKTLQVRPKCTFYATRISYLTHLNVARYTNLSTLLLTDKIINKFRDYPILKHTCAKKT